MKIQTSIPHSPRTITRERSILFLLFEIRSVFVYNSTVFTDFLLYFLIQNVNANKKIFKIKGYKIILNGSNCDRKSQFSEILRPLNSRAFIKTND